MTQELHLIKEEEIIFLRNSDILSTTKRGVTSRTDTGTFVNAASYTLSTSPTLVKNVRSVTVGGTLLARYTDYTINYTTGVITFIALQSGAYSIPYDYGSTDRIFPDYPQENLKLNQFPRIAVDILGCDIVERSLGATTTQHNYIITCSVYSSDTKEVDDAISDIQTAYLNSKSTHHYLRFITPKRISAMVPFVPGSDKIVSRTIDLDAKFNFENI